MPTPSPARRHSSFRPLALLLLALILVLYLGDFTWYELRLHFPKLGPATGSVHRIRLLAIPAKGNKINYEIDSVRPEEDVPCTRSLFPQSGNRPCWYVARHANDPISI
jgi:hypothetical protein